jgi:hypothetical protein
MCCLHWHLRRGAEENRSQNGWSLDSDLNLIPPSYITGVLTICPWYLCNRYLTTIVHASHHCDRVCVGSAALALHCFIANWITKFKSNCQCSNSADFNLLFLDDRCKGDNLMKLRIKWRNRSVSFGDSNVWLEAVLQI